jgi:hypothetical protein
MDFNTMATTFEIRVHPFDKEKGAPRANSLFNSSVWSTLSNTLVKSMNKARTDSPPSRAHPHWWMIETRACVVERPLRAPN